MTYPQIDVMRRDISKVYDGPNWKAKVKHMPDGQVFAIWNKFCDEGKFKKLKSRKTIHSLEDKINEGRADAAVVNEDYYCEQLAFDI
jgi:hypothetical protein